MIEMYGCCVTQHYTLYDRFEKLNTTCISCCKNIKTNKPAVTNW